MNNVGLRNVKFGSIPQLLLSLANIVQQAEDFGVLLHSARECRCPYGASSYRLELLKDGFGEQPSWGEHKRPLT
jgi:hypothetical protein